MDASDFRVETWEIPLLCEVNGLMENPSQTATTKTSGYGVKTLEADGKCGGGDVTVSIKGKEQIRAMETNKASKRTFVVATTSAFQSAGEQQTIELMKATLADEEMATFRELGHQTDAANCCLRCETSTRRHRVSTAPLPARSSSAAARWLERVAPPAGAAVNQVNSKTFFFFFFFIHQNHVCIPSTAHKPPLIQSCFIFYNSDFRCWFTAAFRVHHLPTSSSAVAGVVFFFVLFFSLSEGCRRSLPLVV